MEGGEETEDNERRGEEEGRDKMKSMSERTAGRRGGGDN